MKRSFRKLLCAGAQVGTALMLTATAFASSHREAPFITENPKVDGTDFYLFRSYEPGREGFVTLIANYQPLQDAYGGPNYFTMDPNAVYTIKLDQNGDALEDLEFQFRFANPIRDLQLNIGGLNVSVALINLSSITAGNTSALNVIEFYNVAAVRYTTDRRGRRRANSQFVTHAQSGQAVFVKPVDNIGQKSIADYGSYAATHVYPINVPGCSTPGSRMFVGQRKEGFVVNLGETFDLVNDNPLGPVDGETNTISDKNVTTLALEIPIACAAAAGQPIVGGWTASFLPKRRELSNRPNYFTPAIESGKLVQVSRLGSPLVNEVVIGLKDKDLFNASQPRDDAQFATYVTNPTFPAILQILFPAVTAPTKFPRTDLVQIFLTGVDGLNKNGSTAEMQRLNTSIAPTPIAQQNTLGVIGGDLAGYPNGRRPFDDVVDITLRAAMGVLLSQADAPSGQLPFTDGALPNRNDYLVGFPYLTTPIAGSPAN